MSKNKYPVVYVYIKTKDSGRELKASLRSLDNLTNFNGEVYVIGDREDWFKGINYIPRGRIHGRPFLDQVEKMRVACRVAEMPEKFIAMMDDVYITQPVEAGVYIKGDMDFRESSPHQRSKKATAELLREVYNVEKPIDFETHAPMLVDKFKLLSALNVLKTHQNKKHILQWRSMYGNLFTIEGELFEDKKTKTKELPDGAIVSTQYFIDALDVKFPEKSRYEL